MHKIFTQSLCDWTIKQKSCVLSSCKYIESRRKFQTRYIDWLDLNLSRLAHVKLTSTLKRSGTGRLSSSFTTLALIPSMDWKNILHTSVRLLSSYQENAHLVAQNSNTTCGIHTRGPLDTKHTHINPCAHSIPQCLLVLFYILYLQS